MISQRRFEAIDDYPSKFDWPGIKGLRLCIQSHQCDDKTESGPSFFFRKKILVPLNSVLQRTQIFHNYVALELVSHVRLNVRLAPR